MDQVDQETFFKLDKNKDLKAINYYLKNSLNFKNIQCPGDWTLPCFNSIFLGNRLLIMVFLISKHQKILKIS